MLCEFVIHLQAEPKLLGHFETMCQAERCISRNSAFSMYYFIDSSCRNTNHWPVDFDLIPLVSRILPEVFLQDGLVSFFLCSLYNLLMITCYFNIACFAIRLLKTNSPLIINSNAMLSFSIAVQCLNMI